MSMPDININGVKIHYQLKGSGFPLVMLMGLGGNIDWWPPELVDSLSRHYRLILLDNRGSGRSDVPPTDYSVAMLARDTVVLLDSLGIDCTHIFGISLGGMIAQEIALSRPHRVQKLVLGCTSCGTPHAVLPEAGVLELLVGAGVSTPEELLKILFQEDFIEKNPHLIRELISRYRIAPITPGAFMRQMGAIMGFNSFGRLGEIKHPTLVVCGERDIIIPPENSWILAKNIPHSRLVLLEGCGHGFPAQESARTAGLLLEFLGLG